MCIQLSLQKLMHAIEEARAVLLEAKLNESPSSIRPALPPVKGQKLNTRQQQQAQQQQQQQAAAITARHPPGEEVVLPAAESPGGAGGPVLPYPLPIKEDCSKGSRQLLRWLRQAALEPEVSTQCGCCAHCCRPCCAVVIVRVGFTCFHSLWPGCLPSCAGAAQQVD